jgi:hypothetical protein
MSLAGVGGTITTVLGALGLALEFTDRAFDRASPRPRRTGKRKPLFDTSFGQQNFGSGIPKRNGVRSRKGSRRPTNIFDMPKSRGDFF